MTTLNKYFSNSHTYTPPPEDNIIIISAEIPPIYEDKVKRIVSIKGYSSYQEYLTALFNEDKELQKIIIPYEILKKIDEDYNSIYRGIERDMM